MKHKKKYKKNYIAVGIDEAGRGPIAGPLSVGAVMIIGHLNSKLLKNIKDSKKLSAGQREKWQKMIKKNFENHYVFVSNKIIDKIGIGKALKIGVEKVLRKFSRKPDLVLMDGSLKAPAKYKQQTIIKGDEKIPLISAASVIAKTVRDKKMLILHKKFPQYDFAGHKGYGTKKHYQKIKENGLSGVHRKTFCRNLH